MQLRFKIIASEKAIAPGLDNLRAIALLLQNLNQILNHHIKSPS